MEATKNKVRSVFQTRTGKSAIATFWASLAVGILPLGIDSWARHHNWNPKDTDNAIKAVFVIGALSGVSGSLGALTGRASATDKVASPNWMPGFNEEELEEKDDLNLS